MNKFNQIYARVGVILFLAAFLGFWVMLMGPNAFASGPVGVTMFVFVTLAVLLTVINIGYRTIVGFGPKEKK